MDFRRRSRTFDPTTVECSPIVDLSAEDTRERVLAVAHDAVRDQERVFAVAHDAVRDQERVLAVVHDAVRDQSLPWRKDVSRREVDAQRVAETTRVNAERVAETNAYYTS